jgi:hypothetical protein
MRKSLATALLLGAMASPAAGETPRPVLVELFTSQGCSSCPPADALLTELARNPNVLPLAFHVTYWNNLGWRDPFSLDAATTRQRLYQRTLGTDTIYTPQMVIDGRIDVVGSDRASVARAITASHGGEGVSLTITREGSGMTVRVGEGEGTAQLLLIGYDNFHRTPVARGENAGRQLPETNIVRSITMLKEWTGRSVSLDAAIPAADNAVVVLQSSDGRIHAVALLPKSMGTPG